MREGCKQEHEQLPRASSASWSQRLYLAARQRCCASAGQKHAWAPPAARVRSSCRRRARHNRTSCPAVSPCPAPPQRALMPLHKPKCLPAYHQQLSYCVTQVGAGRVLAWRGLLRCCGQALSPAAPGAAPA